MKNKIKIIGRALWIGACLYAVNYGADKTEVPGSLTERSPLSISVESIHQDSLAEIKKASELLRKHSYSGIKDVRAKKLQDMSEVLPKLQSFCSASQDQFEREWLALQITTLQEMIKVYENASAKHEERESEISAVLYPAQQKQWDLIEQYMRPSSLKSCLQELRSINQEKRTLERQPEKRVEKQSLAKRMAVASENFLRWYDDVSKHDELDQEDLKALAEIDVVSEESVQSLRNIVAFLKKGN